MGAPQQMLLASGEHDDQWLQVVMLAKMNGANNGTSFIDSSSYARTLTAVGNAKTSTAQSVFNGSSGLFDGSGDQITATASSDFDLSGDFTIEGRIWFNSISGGSFVFAFQQASFNGAKTIWLEAGYNNANKMTCYLFGNNILSLSNVSLSQWYYIGIKRAGTTCSFWVDGTQQGTYTSSSSPGSSRIALGGSDGLSAGSTYHDGYLAEWRITKGYARDLSSIPGSPYPTS
jgi:hypothetical protein